MKKYNSLYLVLLMMLTNVFHIVAMDTNWMTQSTIEPFFKEEEVSKKSPRSFKESNLTTQSREKEDKIHSFYDRIKNLDSDKQKIYNPIISDVKKKLASSTQLTDNRIKVIEYTLEMINNKPIDFIIREINNQDTALINKINILKSLSILPRPSIPLTSLRAQQWKLTDWINNSIALKKELVLKITENYKEQTDIIDAKIKNNKPISLKEWKNYKKSLQEYRNIISENTDLKQEIESKIKEVTSTIEDKEARVGLISIARKIRESKDTATIDDLRDYKTKLEDYIATIQKPTTDAEIAKKNAYQEVVENVTRHIDLLTEVDKQLLINYEHFTTNDLWNHLEKLTDLRKSLNNLFSERYEKLDTKIQQLSVYWKLKIKEQEDKRAAVLAKQQEELEQQILEEEQQRAVDEGKKLDEMIRLEEAKQQREALEIQRAKQERLEQERLEQERLEKESIVQEGARQNEALLAEQQRLAQERVNELQRIAQEKREQENQWMPWINNQFTAVQQTVRQTVNTVLNYLRSWWPF